MKFLCAAIVLYLMSAGSGAVAGQLPEQVSGFIELLVREKPPTLAEHKGFNTALFEESGFIRAECLLKGKSIYSESCADYRKKILAAADTETSRELGWIRKRFSTPGQGYQVNSITRHEYNEETEASDKVENYYIVTEVESVDEKRGEDAPYTYYYFHVTIGGHNFKIYCDLGERLREEVHVFSIDGRMKTEYFVEELGWGHHGPLEK